MLQGGVPLLTYHSLDESGSVISVRPALFREQMLQLAARGYRVITVTELLELWDGGGALPERTVVLTFDDAMANFATHALPLLSDLGFRATIYAVSARLGEQNDWPEPAPGIPRTPLLSREALLDLVASGFEVGAHSRRHQRLPRLASSELFEEVVSCKHELEDQLGIAISSFAYPYGAVSPKARALASAHYRSAVGTSLGLAKQTDDRYDLKRVEMYYLRQPAAFKLLGTFAGELYLSARAAGRGLRAAIAR